MRKLLPWVVTLIALVCLIMPPLEGQTSVANSPLDLAGKILMVADSVTGRTVTNLFTFDRGANVPFAVGTSSLKVTNLNADKLDGLDSTGFVPNPVTQDLLFTDATFDIGKLGATRPRDGFFSRNVTIGGTLTPLGLVDASGASAGQFKFPATQNPSSDVNTLDDYEEGTWTPVIGGSGGTSGQAYSTQVGTYIKIGRLVIAQFDVTLSTKGTITSIAQIQGLPFTIENTANYIPSGNVGLWSNTSSSFVYVSVLGVLNTTAASLFGSTAAATTAASLATTDLANNSGFAGTLMYRATN